MRGRRDHAFRRKGAEIVLTSLRKVVDAKLYVNVLTKMIGSAAAHQKLLPNALHLPLSKTNGLLEKGLVQIVR